MGEFDFLGSEMYPPNSHIKDYTDNDYSSPDRYSHISHVKECVTESDLIVNNRIRHSPTPEPLIEMPDDLQGRLVTRLPPQLQEAERYLTNIIHLIFVDVTSMFFFSLHTYKINLEKKKCITLPFYKF